MRPVQIGANFGEKLCNTIFYTCWFSAQIRCQSYKWSGCNFGFWKSRSGATGVKVKLIPRWKMPKICRLRHKTISRHRREVLPRRSLCFRFTIEKHSLKFNPINRFVKKTCVFLSGCWTKPIWNFGLVDVILVHNVWTWWKFLKMLKHHLNLI